MVGMTRTVDFRGVPICRAGEWNGLTGKTEITPSDLQSVVEAYADTEVDRARVKIGHISGMNNALGDGAPAFGWVENPRMDPDGVTLRGDLVGVPRKLGEIVGKAYRNVSVEMRRGVTTPSGRKHRAVLTGLALLGASAPAVKGLDDLVSLYASEAPDGGPEDECTTREAVTVSLGEALADTNPTVLGGQGPGVDTGEDSPESPGRATEEEAGLAFLSEARKALGLDENTPEGDVLEKLTALSEQAATVEVEPQEVGVNPVQEHHESDTDGEAPDATGDNRPETVTVTKAQWDEVTEQLKKLTEKQAEDHRAKVIETALSEGRIVPAERDQWANALAAAPEATEVLLSQLAPRVNISETGSDVALSAQVDDDDAAFEAWADRVGF